MQRPRYPFSKHMTQTCLDKENNFFSMLRCKRTRPNILEKGDLLPEKKLVIDLSLEEEANNPASMQQTKCQKVSPTNIRYSSPDTLDKDETLSETSAPRHGLQTPVKNKGCFSYGTFSNQDGSWNTNVDPVSILFNSINIISMICSFHLQ